MEKKIIFVTDIKSLNKQKEINYIKKIINIINLNISYLIKKL